MKGARYDITGDEAIYQGADWAKEFQLLNPATGAPLDLTGYTFRAQARKQGDDLVPAIEFDCEVSNTETGTFRMSLSNTATAAIPKGRYRYDVEMTDTLNVVHKVITPSTVQVVEEYTK